MAVGHIPDEQGLLGIGDRRAPADHLLDFAYPPGSRESLLRDRVALVADETRTREDVGRLRLGSWRLSRGSSHGAKLIRQRIERAFTLFSQNERTPLDHFVHCFCLVRGGDPLMETADLDAWRASDALSRRGWAISRTAHLADYRDYNGPPTGDAWVGAHVADRRTLSRGPTIASPQIL
jgi:hypothetical protein